MKVSTPLSGDTLLSASDPYFISASLEDTLPTPLRKFNEELEFSRTLSLKLLGAIPTSPTTPASAEEFPPPPPLPPRRTTRPPSYEAANPYRNASLKSPPQLPPSYTPLPHFHPPRFSKRLRSIVSQRPRPLKVDLNAQPMMEKREPMTTVLTVESAAWPPTPKSWVETWLMRWDPRTVLLVSVLGALMVLGSGAFLLAHAWTGNLS